MRCAHILRVEGILATLGSVSVSLSESGAPGRRAAESPSLMAIVPLR